MRVGLKGFAPDELEPRTSEGELVADLLANAGAQFESGSCRSHGSSSGHSARKGDSAALDGAGAGAGVGVGRLLPAATAPAGPRPGSSSGDSASSAPHEQQARQGQDLPLLHSLLNKAHNDGQFVGPCCAAKGGTERRLHSLQVRYQCV